MKSYRIKAPAKINTMLRVVAVRADGYHELEMVMVPLTLADEIELAEIDDGIEIVVDGRSDEGMQGERNLAWRAAKAMKDSSGIEKGVRISLTKRVPIAAGLGGGSSDAAAVLKGLNDMWDLGISADGLAAIGVKLGADVPFFCYGGPAFVGGIGERITPCRAFPNLSVLLIKPSFPVPTPWVYKQWDKKYFSSKNEGLTVNESGARVPARYARAMGRRLEFQVLEDIVASLHNDLETVTVGAYPEIAEIKERLIAFGARAAMMSGSGPTVFGLFESRESRDDALERIGREGWSVFGCETASAF